MQITNNNKERYQGQFAWLFDNIHQRINDKVGDNKTPVSCDTSLRVWNKREFKAAYSELRKAKKVLVSNCIFTSVTVKQFSI